MSSWPEDCLGIKKIALCKSLYFQPGSGQCWRDAMLKIRLALVVQGREQCRWLKVEASGTGEILWLALFLRKAYYEAVALIKHL